MTLDEIKLYLRIDDNAEDTLITKLMAVADSWVEDAVIDYAVKKTNIKFATKADLLKLMLINDMYSDRSTTGDKEQKYKLVYQSLLTQLNYGVFA